ncbi:MAG: type II secretion system protein [Alphaproteobacteria bacterium]|nr:type II secretion system protein [Alphaproteobacteria bacterium]
MRRSLPFPAVVFGLSFRTRGFGLVESMLALVVFSVAIGALIKVWIDDHQTQQVQRQAEVLNTARLANQRLVSFYRNTLGASVAAPSISTAVDGTALVSAISGTVSGAENQWTFTRQNLIDLKLLDANFPVNGVWGSLSTAQLQINLKSSRTDQRTTGTACYDQAVRKEGQVDMAGLSALLAQVSRNVSVVSSTGVTGSSYHSGLFVASYPGAGGTLKGSVGGFTLANPISGTPEGIVCTLIGDWGGAETQGRSAVYAVVTVNSACTEPNALAWLNSQGNGRPQHIVWCNGSNWKLLNGAEVGGACQTGRMAVVEDPASAEFLQPLMCGPGNTYLLGRLAPVKERLTCDASTDGFMAIGQTDSKIYRCASSAGAFAWTTTFSTTVNFGFASGTTLGGTCTPTDAIGTTTTNQLTVCRGGTWQQVSR